MKWTISGKNYQFTVNSTKDAIAALLEMDENAMAKAHESKTSPKDSFFLKVWQTSTWGTQILIYSKIPMLDGRAVANLEEKSVQITDGNPAENLLDEVRKALKKF